MNQNPQPDPLGGPQPAATQDPLRPPNQNNQRSQKIRGFLRKEQLAALRGGHLRALGLTLCIYGGIAAAFALAGAYADLPAPLSYSIYLVSFLTIGWCQFALSNGLHEALHHNFFNRRTDLLADLLLGFPLGVRTAAYRQVHLAHHRHFGDPALDPDYPVYARFPRSRLQMLAVFATYASGVPAARQFLDLLRKGGSPAAASGVEDRGVPQGGPLGLLVYHGALLLAISVWLGPLYYLGLWILPLCTVAKTLSALRLFCEHAVPQEPGAPPFVIRTVTGSPIEVGTLGPYGFHYHGEHHILPSVPYAHLGALHELLSAARAAGTVTGPDAAHYELFQGGYAALLAGWVRRLPWRAPARP